MRINGLAAANYYWSYKYSKGAAVTPVAGDALTSFTVGRIPNTTGGQAMGIVRIPFWSIAGDQQVLAEWTLHESAAVADFEEKGEMGGWFDHSLGIRSISFDFFASAGLLSGRAYLYGWCPEIETGGGPHD